jgi:phosphate transport system permease protein
MNRLAARRAYSAFMVGVAGFCTVLAAGVLVAVIFYVIENGSAALTPTFFTKLPAPIGVPGGGIANAILGSVEIIALASLGAVPIGVLAGIYLALFGRGKTAIAVRFLSDVLTACRRSPSASSPTRSSSFRASTSPRCRPRSRSP